jgi:hypothetical protein
MQMDDLQKAKAEWQAKAPAPPVGGDYLFDGFSAAVAWIIECPGKPAFAP